LEPLVTASNADRAFLTEQYRLHADRVFKRCVMMSGGDIVWAQDLTHDVFMRLIRDAGKLDRSESLGSWLLKVATRMCIDRWRHDRRVWPRVRAALTSLVSAEEEILQQSLPQLSSADPHHELLCELRASLDELPPKERAVVVMKYVDGLQQTEIAVTLGCSTGYVSKLHSRALDRLRRRGWEMDHV
jgi:RNA polymerase sigma factor (sigma-70 family)